MAGLHQALPKAPRLLSRVEREVLMAAAAERTARRTRMLASYCGDIGISPSSAFSRSASRDR